VAVIGSVFASLYGSRLTSALPVGLPARLSDAAHSSVGAALQIAARARATGHLVLGSHIHAAASAAFFHGLAAGCRVAGVVAAAGAVMALLLLPAQPGRYSGDVAVPAEPEPEPVAALAR